MALGAAFGVDVPIAGNKWKLCAGLRYMKTGTNQADIDPLIATLGFGYRF